VCDFFATPKIAVWKNFGNSIITVASEVDENSLLAAHVCSSVGSALQQHFKNSSLLSGTTEPKELMMRSDEVTLLIEQLCPQGQPVLATQPFLKQCKQRLDLVLKG